MANNAHSITRDSKKTKNELLFPIYCSKSFNKIFSISDGCSSETKPENEHFHCFCRSIGWRAPKCEYNMQSAILNSISISLNDGKWEQRKKKKKVKWYETKLNKNYYEAREYARIDGCLEMWFSHWRKQIQSKVIRQWAQQQLWAAALTGNK